MTGDSSGEKADVGFGTVASDGGVALEQLARQGGGKGHQRLSGKQGRYDEREKTGKERLSQCELQKRDGDDWQLATQQERTSAETWCMGDRKGGEDALAVRVKQLYSIMASTRLLRPTGSLGRLEVAT